VPPKRLRLAFLRDRRELVKRLILGELLGPPPGLRPRRVARAVQAPAPSTTPPAGPRK
jgi:hypothetical protein